MQDSPRRNARFLNSKHQGQTKEIQAICATPYTTELNDWSSDRLRTAAAKRPSCKSEFGCGSIPVGSKYLTITHDIQILQREDPCLQLSGASVHFVYPGRLKLPSGRLRAESHAQYRQPSHKTLTNPKPQTRGLGLGFMATHLLPHVCFEAIAVLCRS